MLKLSRHIRMLAAAAFSGICSVSEAASDHHDHGVGHMQIVQDGTVVAIRFQSPAADLFGFEHQPRTDTEHRQINAVKQRLNDGNTLFNAIGAQCRVRHQTTEFSGNTSTSINEIHPHADVVVNYEMICTRIERLTELRVLFFDSFDNLQVINVEWIVHQGQGVGTLSPDKPWLRF